MGLGKILKRAARGSILGPMGALANVVSGGKVGDFMFGTGKGKDAGNAVEGGTGYKGLTNAAAAAQSPALQAALAKYSQGGDLAGAYGTQGVDGSALGDQLAIDPRTGTKMATEQVMNNPLLSGIYGKGGMQERLLSEEQDLGSRGYSMQPEDNEAFGQASDEIARQSGQEDASLSRALASRGLASAGSGAAGAAFSGAQGNKFERLASQQRNIAQARMDTNLKRLTSTRELALQSGKQAGAELDSQYSRNADGVNRKQNINKEALAADIELQNQRNNQFSMQQNTKKPGAIVALGQAAGTAIGGYLGGPQGAAAGGSLGKSLGSSASR